PARPGAGVEEAGGAGKLARGVGPAGDQLRAGGGDAPQLARGRVDDGAVDDGQRLEVAGAEAAGHDLAGAAGARDPAHRLAGAVGGEEHVVVPVPSTRLLPAVPRGRPPYGTSTSCPHSSQRTRAKP